MGTDMHGPWVEVREKNSQRHGRGSWECMAEIMHPTLRRDYLLQDILGGMRHGPQDFSLNQTALRTTLDDQSEEWFRHTHTFVRNAREFAKQQRKELDEFFFAITVGRIELTNNTWYEDAEVYPMSTHGGYSAITLDQAKKAQRIYVAQSAARALSPEGQVELAKIAEHERKRAAGEKAGMLTVSANLVHPERHEGLDFVISAMQWVSDTNQDCEVRAVYCFSF